ncbi:hypothetical protein ACIPPR_36665 [Streptomyces nigra]|uniref:hypothetical protein n=1 Tax=Streptomyces nigra TaxID=1827580 RepID=UPI003808722E
MDATMHVRLPKGMLRGLRLNLPDVWDELERARWLRVMPASEAGESVAELLDATLLGQAPARDDRRHAADWALRVSCLSRGGAVGPLSRLASVYLAAHATHEAGSGWSPLEQMARTSGVEPSELPCVLDQLAKKGLLASWRVCPESYDLHWTLAGKSRPTRQG